MVRIILEGLGAAVMFFGLLMACWRLDSMAKADKDRPR